MLSTYFEIYPKIQRITKKEFVDSGYLFSRIHLIGATGASIKRPGINSMIIQDN